MLAHYIDGTVVINVLIGRRDLDRLERQKGLASAKYLSGTGERVFVGYIEYTTTPLAEPAAFFDGHSIDLMLPRHFRAQHMVALDETYIPILTPMGKRDPRVLRINVQPYRDIPL